jgi:hypothetical protein
MGHLYEIGLSENYSPCLMTRAALPGDDHHQRMFGSVILMEWFRLRRLHYRKS